MDENRVLGHCGLITQHIRSRIQPIVSTEANLLVYSNYICSENKIKSFLGKNCDCKAKS